MTMRKASRTTRKPRATRKTKSIETKLEADPSSRFKDNTLALGPHPTSKGSLVIIGGREDKSGQMEILEQVVRLSHGGRIVVSSLASELPDELWGDYHAAFKKLGAKKLSHLDIRSPEEARLPKTLRLLDDATCVFFTGGDQLRITTKLGGTPIAERIFEIHRQGGVIAGTSAGASMMGETMLVGGENQESHKVGNWMMAPGMGLLKETIIDQHFAQRGRIGRLLGAVALNPGILGVGIDENTGIIVRGQSFEVIGANATYVVDGRSVTYTNISEAEAERTMSMHDVRLHILSSSETFDLMTRRPSGPVPTA